MEKDFIKFALPFIGDEEKKEVVDVLDSGWLTTGPKVKQFETDFAEYVGAKHAIAVCSGTAALHLSLEAIGLKEENEVIIPTYTFAATAEVVRYFKAKPVFVDIDENTFNIDHRLIDEKVTDKTVAIMPVHFAGLACDMDAIDEIAQKYNLHVIEDAAHALPTAYKGRSIGSISEFTCFSFYVTKTIATGEGGMVTTDNDEYAERMKIMSLHGISKDAWKRYSAEGNWHYDIIAPGYKYNMTDIAAALGLCQLRKCEQMWERRKQIADLYTQAFSTLEEITTPYSLSFPKDYGVNAYHLYTIQLCLQSLQIDRGRFIEEMRSRNIGCGVHFIPLHLHTYYRDTLGHKKGDFPVAEEVFERIVSLPIYPGLTDEDVKRIIGTVKDIIYANKA